MINDDLYAQQPQLVLGFHGCEKKVRDEVLSSPTKHLNKSSNAYDWLGNGIYFWLNDPIRALEWAKQQHKKEPAVIGAVIYLGDCLNLCERRSIKQLQEAYKITVNELEISGLELKENKESDAGGFKLLRYRDCAIIERLHLIMKANGYEYDTVYGYFQEGEDAYPGAAIKEKTHIQICVRNTDCIKGYFLPRQKLG